MNLDPYDDPQPMMFPDNFGTSGKHFIYEALNMYLQFIISCIMLGLSFSIAEEEWVGGEITVIDASDQWIKWQFSDTCKEAKKWG